MKKKFIQDFDNFIDLSSTFLAENMHKARATFKYRNRPGCGKLYVTNDNKCFKYKFTKRSDLDNIDSYFKSLLHMIANKPIQTGTSTDEKEANISKKKVKKGKKN